jgi:hypothetical protein
MTLKSPAYLPSVGTGRRHTIGLLLLAFAGYTALAVVITFPLVLHLSSRVPADLMDSLWYVTVLGWNAQAVPLTGAWWDGFAFYPATGMMAFSDHLLGASLLASPLQWLGCGPLTAYNLTFLASFSLAAIAAHALAFTLTGRHDAALICGLAYGFNPYRVAHLAHLEILLAFGMPLALIGLHGFATTRRSAWLLAFAAGLVLQALTSSYHALFFTVLAALWILWFVRPRAWRDAAAIGIAGCLSALVVVPIAAGYARIHQVHHLSRDPAEIFRHSADLTSFVTAPALSALWGWTSFLNDGERQLFPGLTMVMLATAAAVILKRSYRAERNSLAIAVRACWALSACFFLVAAGAYLAGPWQLDWGWLRISVSGFHKPLSLSAALAIGAIALGPTWRAAFRDRSALAFYLMAAFVLFLCSLGPKPTLFNEQVLYEPPYAWLMRLPFFADGGVSVPTVRVPARFAMPGLLALAVTASLAVAHLATSGRRRIALVLAASAGIVADGWIRELPLHRPPEPYLIPPGIQAAAVLELPLGGIAGDTAAMYRAMLRGTPTANGYHSYAPLSYHMLRIALRDRDQTALDALAAFGPILIAADTDAKTERPWSSFVADHPDATRVGEDRNWTLFYLPSKPLPADGCGGYPVGIAAAFDQEGPNDAIVAERTPAVRWTISRPQRAGDELLLHLEATARPCGLVLSLGDGVEHYPRALRVDTSLDMVTWTPAFLGRMGGSAFLAALENPENPRLSIPLKGAAARFVRVRLEEARAASPGLVADIALYGQRPPRGDTSRTPPRTSGREGRCRAVPGAAPGSRPSSAGSAC